VASGATRARRIDSVDLLRGIVMIVMALDHTRDFFGVPGVSPTNLAQTTAPLFFTRWITHLCAPVFFLLTGTGASLSLARRSRAGLSRFLVTRGLWIVVLELTLLRCFGYQFNIDYHVTLLVVLWALGWAMVALAGLVWLPAWAILTIGLVLIAGHNLLDGVRSTNALWIVLHAQNFVVNRPGFVVFVAYPLIPWIGVTAVGYALGQVYRWPAERRVQFLWRVGWALTIAFVLLRTLNVYGDPVPWRPQPSSVTSVIAFLNVTKYPPSLLFLLMTIGPALMLLALLERRTAAWLAPALTFGRVPLFYFLLHLPLIHLVAVVFCLARYGTAHWMFESPDLANYPFTPPPGWGYSLPVVYVIWIGVVLALYPACRWFAAVKQRSTSARLSYL